jgi:hypothetical protein
MLDREQVHLKELTGADREKHFGRMVKMCAAAQRLSKTDATARLHKLARKIIGITADELKDAIKAIERKEQSDGQAAAKRSAPKPAEKGANPNLSFQVITSELTIAARDAFQSWQKRTAISFVTVPCFYSYQSEAAPV